MGIPIVAGHDFADLMDVALSARAVVNEELVRRFSSGVEVIGRKVQTRGNTFAITGVVRKAINESFGQAPPPVLYLSYRDRPSFAGDMLYAQLFGQDTPIPSMQLCIEPVDQGGGCGFGYSCTYADTISWASPTRPLPMVRDPRIVFDTLFGALRLGQDPRRRQELLAEDRSLLDRVMASAARLTARLGPGDRARLNEYLDNVREVERRIQNIEAYSRSGEPREMPEAPAGVPDSFSAHVKLMFDLQALALASDITRVFAFKLGRDNSNRVYPESGFGGAFHPTSHHSGKEDKIVNFAKLNTFHVSLVPYFLETLKNTPEGDGTLLDSTVVLYGSSMGDSNQHSHRRVPFFIVGKAGGAIAGGRHLKAANQTPLANVMLGVLHALGAEDVKEFGDSEAEFDLKN